MSTFDRLLKTLDARDDLQPALPFHALRPGDPFCWREVRRGLSEGYLCRGIVLQVEVDGRLIVAYTGQVPRYEAIPGWWVGGWEAIGVCSWGLEARPKREEVE